MLQVAGMALEAVKQPVINGYFIAGSLVGPGGAGLIKVTPPLPLLPLSPALPLCSSSCGSYLLLLDTYLHALTWVKCPPFPSALHQQAVRISILPLLCTWRQIFGNANAMTWCHSHPCRSWCKLSPWPKLGCSFCCSRWAWSSLCRN